MTELAGALLEGVVDRLTRPDYRAFEAQLRSSGYCARPVRLSESVEVCDGHGELRRVWSTDGEPDELLRKACGNRREAVCGPCAERYRGDAWQLIAAGLRSIFTLARRMGTSVQMIDSTYGHLAQDAEDQDRGLLDAYDAASGHVVGTAGEVDDSSDEGPK
jgi:hypothetical protein